MDPTSMLFRNLKSESVLLGYGIIKAHQPRGQAPKLIGRAVCRLALLFARVVSGTSPQETIGLNSATCSMPFHIGYS
jgi:hypothetical protein